MPFLFLLTAAVVVVLTFMLFSSVMCLFVFDIITMSDSRTETVFNWAERCISCNVIVAHSNMDVEIQLYAALLHAKSVLYKHTYIWDLQTCIMTWAAVND